MDESETFLQQVLNTTQHLRQIDQIFPCLQKNDDTDIFNSRCIGSYRHLKHEIAQILSKNSYLIQRFDEFLAELDLPEHIIHQIIHMKLFKNSYSLCAAAIHEFVSCKANQATVGAVRNALISMELIQADENLKEGLTLFFDSIKNGSNGTSNHETIPLQFPTGNYVNPVQESAYTINSYLDPSEICEKQQPSSVENKGFVIIINYEYIKIHIDVHNIVVQPCYTILAVGVKIIAFIKKSNLPSELYENLLYKCENLKEWTIEFAQNLMSEAIQYSLQYNREATIKNLISEELIGHNKEERENFVTVTTTHVSDVPMRTTSYRDVLVNGHI